MTCYSMAAKFAGLSLLVLLGNVPRAVLAQSQPTDSAVTPDGAQGADAAEPPDADGREFIDRAAGPGDGAGPARPTDDNNFEDPPGRVGRINYVEGTVSFKSAAATAWTAAPLNQPLARGDSLWADSDGRVEAHIGSVVLRLAAQSSLSIINLDDRTVQLGLTQGSVQIRIREHMQGELMELDAPNAAVSLLEIGEYRVDVATSGKESEVTVRDGQAEVLVLGSEFVVPAGQTGSIQGSSKPTHEVQVSDPPDDFDTWCTARDQRENNPESLKYVSREMVGYEDLDNNGTWQDAPEYGPVWTPTTVALGWAPYRFGSWSYVWPWGWTWVDSAAWGFAPFHYGRWANWRGNWCWVPGARVSWPVYAPALVGFAATAGFATLGWFPLGPHEPYVPGYRVSYAYMRKVNAAHIGNLTSLVNIDRSHYINRNRPGAMTAVPRQVFQESQPVASAHLDSAAAQLRTASVVSTPQIIPTAGSFANHASTAPVHAPPQHLLQRAVVSRIEPPQHSRFAPDSQPQRVHTFPARQVALPQRSHSQPEPHIINVPPANIPTAAEERGGGAGRREEPATRSYQPRYQPAPHVYIAPPRQSVRVELPTQERVHGGGSVHGGRHR